MSPGGPGPFWPSMAAVGLTRSLSAVPLALARSCLSRSTCRNDRSMNAIRFDEILSEELQ